MTTTTGTRYRLRDNRGHHRTELVNVEDVATTLRRWVRDHPVDDLDDNLADVLGEEEGSVLTVAEAIDNIEALLLSGELPLVEELAEALNVIIEEAGTPALDTQTLQFTRSDGGTVGVPYGVSVYRLMATDIVDGHLAVAGAGSLNPDPLFDGPREGAISRIAGTLETHGWDSWDDPIDYDLLWRW